MQGLHRIKFKNVRKGRLRKMEFKANSLKFGVIGLKATQSGILKTKQLHAARQVISKIIKKSGKVWTRVFACLPISSKPTGSRMGKGKGQLDHWSAKVSSGTILFEICSKNKEESYWALKSASKKLPLKTKILYHYYSTTNYNTIK